MVDISGDHLMREVLWRPSRFDWRDAHRIVWVSIAALDTSWRKDGVFYLPPMLGSEGRYVRFGSWLRSNHPRRRVKMPVVGWCPDKIGTYHISFEDGRHRTAWLRDHGATALPVLVHHSDYEAIADNVGTAERQTIATMEP